MVNLSDFICCKILLMLDGRKINRKRGREFNRIAKGRLNQTTESPSNVVMSFDEPQGEKGVAVGEIKYIRDTNKSSSAERLSERAMPVKTRRLELGRKGSE